MKHAVLKVCFILLAVNAVTIAATTAGDGRVLMQVINV